MMERLGVRNEWRDKSKLAYAKIQQLLDPSFRPEPETGSGAGNGATPAGSESPPPIPTAPERPQERDENRGAPNRTPEGPTRQIL